MHHFIRLRLHALAHVLRRLGRVLEGEEARLTLLQQRGRHLAEGNVERELLPLVRGRKVGLRVVRVGRSVGRCVAERARARQHGNSTFTFTGDLTFAFTSDTCMLFFFFADAWE